MRYGRQAIALALSLPGACLAVGCEEGEDSPTKAEFVRQATATVGALKAAVSKGETKPVALVGKNAVGPFARVERLARAYGFRACAEPL